MGSFFTTWERLDQAATTNVWTRPRSRKSYNPPSDRVSPISNIVPYVVYATSEANESISFFFSLFLPTLTTPPDGNSWRSILSKYDKYAPAGRKAMAADQALKNAARKQAAWYVHKYRKRGIGVKRPVMHKVFVLSRCTSKTLCPWLLCEQA